MEGIAQRIGQRSMAFHETVAFYHALVGGDRKREIENLLRTGEVRILFYAEALGMVGLFITSTNTSSKCYVRAAIFETSNASFYGDSRQDFAP